MPELTLPRPSSSFSGFTLPTPSDAYRGNIVLPEPEKSVAGENSIVFSPRKRQRVNYSDNSNRRPQIIKKNAKTTGPSLSQPESSTTEVDSMGMNDQHISEQATAYDEYVDYVLAGAAGFFQISDEGFVVQGWDGRRKTTKPLWYHLHRTSEAAVCFCPTIRSLHTCVHTRFLEDYGEQQFPQDNSSNSPKSSQSVVLFFWEETGGEPRQWFSVASDQRKDSIKNRSIVSHVGPNPLTGEWKCVKDGMPQCAHQKKASALLAQLVNLEMTEEAGEVTGDINSALDCVVDSPRGISPVSHRPILVPTWASLPSDRTLYARPSAMRAPPDLISLGEHARCSCGCPISRELPIFTANCLVYTILEPFNRPIELQACPNKCSKSQPRFIGPDGAEIGLFNYNNHFLFSHDLLDDYTKAYTSSETPFTAWIGVVQERYGRFTPDSSFVTEEIFRAVWFSYASLQDFGGEMTCPTCGLEPPATIFDGITLAFGKKYLTSSLKPPTTIDSHSKTRTRRYVKGQAAIQNPSLRKLVRKVVTGRSLVVKDSDLNGGDAAEESEDGSDEDLGDLAKAKASRARMAAEMEERVKAIGPTKEGLAHVNQSLSSLFDRYCGLTPILHKRPVPRQIRSLFHQIAAEESIVQMIPNPSLMALKRFNNDPSRITLDNLRCIPSIYHAIRFEWEQSESGQFPELLDVCSWLESRAEAVLNSLLQNGPEDNETFTPITNEDKDWIKSGCLYSMPQIRSRPMYPHLKHDQNADASGKNRSKCSKHYSEYGQKRLTGGVMVCWCSHSIAYGFHCIPKAEGRNDVFSAIYTRWKKAPTWIVYDFACSSAPYCMTREADFFKNTRQGIDDCHSNGHTKCWPACFIKTYADLDPTVARINTSAAECGNQGLNRIRKSVSYMKQERAIIYIRTFIAVWNRLKIRRIASTH